MSGINLSSNTLDESIQKLVNDNPRNVVVPKEEEEQEMYVPSKRKKRKKKMTEEERMDLDIAKNEAKDARNLIKQTIVKIDDIVYRVTSKTDERNIDRDGNRKPGEEGYIKRPRTVKEDSAKGEPVGKFFYDNPHASRGLITEEASRLFPIFYVEGGTQVEWSINRDRDASSNGNYFLFKNSEQRTKHFKEVDRMRRDVAEGWARQGVYSSLSKPSGKEDDAKKKDLVRKGILLLDSVGEIIVPPPEQKFYPPRQDRESEKKIKAYEKEKVSAPTKKLSLIKLEQFFREDAYAIELREEYPDEPLDELFKMYKEIMMAGPRRRDFFNLTT